MKKIFSIIFCLIIKNIHAQTPGTLDSSFGINGKVTTPVGTGLSVSFANIIQNDGKILVGGFAENGIWWDDFTMVRYEGDGSLDSTFGINGIVTTDITDIDDAYSMALLPNGKILLAGFTSNVYDNMAIARYNANGTLDSTFSNDGKVTVSFLGENADIESIAVQPDGKIVAAGFVGFAPLTDFAVLRFKPNGSLDTSFSQDGKIRLTIAPNLNVATSVAIQPDGKIVAAGYTMNDIVVVRFHLNGTLDSTFGTGGIVTTTIGATGNSIATSLFIQPDDKIVVSGHSSLNMCHVRYNTNGSLDATFGNGGIAVTIFSGASSVSHKSVLQPDGKILTAATFYNGGNRDFLLTCHNSNGTLDTTFGFNGYVTTDFNGDEDEPYSLALQQDGKIVVCGYYTTGTSMYFATARYMPALTVGIENLNSNNSFFNFYPNPTHDIINIRLLSKVKNVVITNLIGSIVMEKHFLSNLNESFEINVSTLCPGIYFINAGNEVKKFVKE